MISNRQRICRKCGIAFYGKAGRQYCDSCLLKVKANTVLRDRICQDCGAVFSGGPRAKRCPARRLAAKRAYKHKQTIRPLGSIDTCQFCGQPYTVMSGKQKYCCTNCAAKAVREIEIANKPRTRTQLQKDKRVSMLRSIQKVCAYCLKSFAASGSNTVYCSDYCRKQAHKLQIAECDVRRGRARNLEKYYNQRQSYRNTISLSNS